MDAFKYHLLGLLIVCTISACESEQKLGRPTEGIFVLQKPETVLEHLGSEVWETSGLITVRDMLWTHNDSGDEPLLYRINPEDGDVLQIIHVGEADHVDWEDLTHDDEYIYIGDFGNNAGNRKDLKVYKLPIDSLPSLDRTRDTIEASCIYFSYPDQESFLPMRRHNFDAEALISVGDSLYIFSKNRENTQTKLYALPKKNGSYVAKLKDKFETYGSITGAACDEDGLVCLLGYTVVTHYHMNFPFVWVFYDYPGTQFLRGNHFRIDLDVSRQVEGIAPTGDGDWLISAEKTDRPSASLYRLPIDFDSLKQVYSNTSGATHTY